MSIAVGNTGSYVGDAKGSNLISARQDSQNERKTFAEIQASQQAVANASDSSGTAGSSSSNTPSSATMSERHAADQLLMQSRATIQQGNDAKATTDSSRVTQQSVGNATTADVTAQTAVATVRGNGQLLIQERQTIQQSADPKWAADGSKTDGQTSSASAATTAQQTTGFPSGTFKALFGELPANLDQSGLSGIVNAQGHNLSNQEIISYFAQNPSITQMEQDKTAMGLSNTQMANAIAIAMGQAHTASNTDQGNNSAANNLYANTWGVSATQGLAAAASSANAAVNYFA